MSRSHSRDLEVGDVIRRPGKPDIEIYAIGRFEFQTIEEGLVTHRTKKCMRGVFSPRHQTTIIREGVELQ